MAYYFGASKFTDAFLVAYRIPNLFRDLLAEGAFSQAFVPVLQEKLKESKEAARILCWRAFLWLGLVTIILAGIMFIFAPQIVGFFAPSFQQDQSLWSTCVFLTRTMLPYLVLVTMAAMLMATLNALKHFFLPAISTLFFNISMILSTVIGFPFLRDQGIEPVYCLAIGVLIGGSVQFFMQLVLIIRAGFGPIKVKLQADHSIKKIGKNLSVGFIGFAAVQINLIVNTILATSSGLGAVSWLTYAFRLFQFPVGVFAVSLSSSHLVYFSEAWKKGETEKALEYFKASFNFSLVLLIPIAVITYILAPSLVELVFERGAFDSSDTLSTGLALSLYAVGIPFYGLYKIFGPTFFALDKPQFPLYGTIIAVIINIVFSLQMIPIMGFSALALGTSLGSIGSVVFQISILKNKLKLPLQFFVGMDLVKIAISATLMGHALVLLQDFWAGGNLVEVNLYIKAFCSMLLGVVSFGFVYAGLNFQKFFSKKVK